nr:immunoglobulin light chain junction region [Macaca mulatta]
YLQDTQLPPTF